MAIKTNYNYNGLEVAEAYIKIERLWGNSKDGWGSLVSVNNIVLEDEIEVKKEITTFNHNTPFIEDERGYTTLYKSLLAQYGGESI